MTDSAYACAWGLGALFIFCALSVFSPLALLFSSLLVPFVDNTPTGLPRQLQNSLLSFFLLTMTLNRALPQPSPPCDSALWLMSWGKGRGKDYSEEVNAPCIPSALFTLTPPQPPSYYLLTRSLPLPVFGGGGRRWKEKTGRPIFNYKDTEIKRLAQGNHTGKNYLSLPLPPHL